MNPIIRHYGRILENGNILFYNEELWENQRKSLLSKEFELVIKEKHKRPTISQFSYYFGCILSTCITCEQFSHYSTVEEIHKDIFAPMFLSYQNLVRLGKKSWLQTHTRSLADLTKKETSTFIEKVLMFCAQEGIEILAPDQYENKYYKEIIKK